MSFKCPLCGIGEMIIEIIPKRHTKLDGIPLVVENARISRCNHCNEISVHAKELKRWRKEGVRECNP